MTLYRSISTALTRARDLTRKIIRQRGSLQDVQKRLGTPFEEPGDFELAHRLAHELGGLIQEMELVVHVLNAKPSASEIQTADAAK